MRDREEIKVWDALADHYLEKVLSPLAKGVESPLFDYIAKLKIPDHKRAADFGCGTGMLLNFLSKHFDEVYAIDFSPRMLEVARESNRSVSNIAYVEGDLRDLRDFVDFFDVGFSINSVVPTVPSDAPVMVEQIFRSLRLGGTLVAVFPSFEAVKYQYQLSLEQRVSSGIPRDLAEKEVDAYFFKRNKLDLDKGTYADDGKHIQKFFCKQEICDLLTNVGFEIVYTDKVLYPWSLTKKVGYGYFPTKPEIWDWFIVSHKDA